MLSISELSTGQHRYYLDQAGERVDVVESVGDGAGEYYVGGTEARGEWLGAGARALGLEGLVDGEALRRVLAGEDNQGEQLRASRVPVSVAGYDLTFSAPKSVSVLFALGEADVREAVRAAHERAVREALGYAERTAAAVRRGAGGSRVEPAGGFIAATFRHRTSRAGDPQLHTHVLVANLAQGPDGRWSTLDGRRQEGRWRPWRRRELQTAVEREAAARRTVEDLARVVAEQRHASRPGLDERIERRRRAEQRDRIIEREMKRSVARGLER